MRVEVARCTELQSQLQHLYLTHNEFKTVIFTPGMAFWKVFVPIQFWYKQLSIIIVILYFRGTPKCKFTKTIKTIALHPYPTI